MMGLIAFSVFLICLCIVVWVFKSDPEPKPPWHDIYDPSFDSSVKKKKWFGPGAATGVLLSTYFFRDK